MTKDFLGLPVWKRMYGFGDVGTLDARMLTAFLGNVDRRALAGMLPEHPTLRLLAGAPLVVIQSDFTRVIDNGDPDRNEYRYHEVMIAAVVGGVGDPRPALFPLVLFVDDPLIMASGREFYGFPKVMGEVTFERRRAVVRHTSFPNGVRTTRDVMRATWGERSPLVARVLTSAAQAVGELARAAGVDEDTFDFVTNLSAAPFGRVINLRQLPDLSNPRRASRSELTLFAPKLVDPKLLSIVGEYRLELPDDPVWSLGRRLFANAAPKTILAFDWQATFLVTTGEVIDAW
jgi:hypothetical protein